MEYLLLKNLKIYLEAIKRSELFENLSDPSQWQLLVVRTPEEKMGRRKRSMESFRTEVWDQELGTGGLIGDLTDLDKSPIALITTGHLRRFVPVWENRKYVAPCEATCPTGIPIQERWRLIREGRVDEAVDLALAYTPFPATVCGYLCPNLCVQSCTRQSFFMTPVDVQQLGKASIAAKLPELPPESGKRIAVIGGGPAGISVAWQLRQGGHYVTIYDMAKTLGGKITAVVPDSRVPAEIVDTELARIKKVLPHVHLQQRMERKEVEQLREDVDFVVIATGDKAKALTGLMYAKNAILRKWMDDVKVVYFGPSEQLMFSDPDVANAAIEIAGMGETFACKAISDRDGISEKIDEMGVKVEYVGTIISDYIKDGYAPMVW